MKPSNMIYCKDFSAEELHERFPNGKSRGYYITALEAYVAMASTPHPKTNGLGPCPFARAETVKDRVQYSFINVKEANWLEEGVKMIRDFDLNPNKKTQLIIILDEDNVSGKLGRRWAGQLTNAYAKAFPPTTEKESIVALISNWKEDDQYSYINAPQFLFFLVQYNKDLDDAIDVLIKAGYYDKLENDDLVIDATAEHKVITMRKEGKCPYPHQIKERVREEGEEEIDYYQQKENKKDVNS